MRYQYTSQGYLNSLKQPQQSGVTLLLAINIIVFLVLELLLTPNNVFYKFIFYNCSLISIIPNDMALNSAYIQQFQPWQCLTYLFLHGGILHLFFNMLGLWFLGRDLETLWGKTNFLKYYFTVGIGSGIITVLYNIQYIDSNDILPIVGASGAIYGLLLAYGILFPNRILYIYGIFPVKVKNAVIIMGLIAFFYSITLKSSGISHITHLAGIIMGILYLQYWTHLRQSKKIIKLHKDSNQNTHIKKEVDEILDKIQDIGWGQLSEYEKELLKKHSKSYGNDNNPN